MKISKKIKIDFRFLKFKIFSFWLQRAWKKNRLSFSLALLAIDSENATLKNNKC